jgi:predicted RNA binding protein YcfA (HicA-like mRNA interferase family)
MSAMSANTLYEITQSDLEVYFEMKKQKLLQNILSSPQNVRFNEMVGLVEAFGFRLSRISGSHHIFTHPEITEIVNLQNVKGQAKPYQVNQFLKLVEKYDLELKEK